MLNNWANGEAMLLAVAFSMKADMPSGPLALLTSSLFIRETIPALQHENHTVTEDTDKASLLNTFFASCWNTVEQPLTEESYHCADLPTHVVTPEEVFALFLLSSFTVFQKSLELAITSLSKYSLFLILIRLTILFLSFLYC